jgi:hypothetical protein
VGVGKGRIVKAAATLATAKLGIGLSQAGRLAQMRHGERLSFIADGLPILLQSSRSFQEAFKALPDHIREADVLQCYAIEEAAKALILMDVVRCPPPLVGSRIGAMIQWFYSHLARLIYADATMWKPVNVEQLQEYADQTRKSYHVDGEYGEYISPNDHLLWRESRLYVDVAAAEDGALFWNDPQAWSHGLWGSEPQALRKINALSAIGAFSAQGVIIVADVWGKTEFKDVQNFEHGRQLTQEMLRRLNAQGLVKDHVTDEQLRSLYDGWQLPMYNVDLRRIPVSMEELEAQRSYPADY